MSDNPELSGVNKRIRITMEAEGYGTSTKEWMVPEEILRPYAIAYDTAIAAAGLEISKAIYDALIDGDVSTAETMVGKPMINAVKS